jgi:hypothetical protein
LDPVKVLFHATAAVLLSLIVQVSTAELTWRGLSWDGLSSLGVSLAMDFMGPVATVFQILLLLWRLFA